VNFRLLARKLHEGDFDDFGSSSSSSSTLSPTNMLHNTTFILLDEPLRELERLPEPLWSLLSYLYSSLFSLSTETLGQPPTSLPELVLLPSGNIGPHVQVPLAGVLLGYPTAYVPVSHTTSQDNEAYLSGHALDVFELGLRSSQTGDTYVKSRPPVTQI
jgi:hypothetical protein